MGSTKKKKVAIEQSEQPLEQNRQALDEATETWKKAQKSFETLESNLERTKGLVIKQQQEQHELEKELATHEELMYKAENKLKKK